MNIYLDACCLNRLTDDQSQHRIRVEAEAVELILGKIRTGEVRWVSSEALSDEINRNPQLERRLENTALLNLATETIEVDSQIAERARNLRDVGYGAFDALHIACAESARVDVLLTTDDAFIRRALRGDGSPGVRIANPLSWSQRTLS